MPAVVTCTEMGVILQKQPPEVFYKKGALKDYVIFTGKHLCSNLRLQHRCFSENIAKSLRKSILKNICERLLLLLERSNF